MDCAPFSPKPVVAVDVDEELGAFVDALCNHVNSAGFAATSSSAAIAGSAPRKWQREDFHSYHFDDVWQVGETISSETVERFFDSPHFAQLEPLPGAREVLERHRASCRFVVCTSRSLNIEAKTRAWINEHFPGIFDDVLFGSAYGHGPRRTKREMCASIGAVALIDDNVGYALDAAPVLAHSVLFGRYAWNASTPPDAPSNLVRLASWSEVDAFLTTLNSK
jgi:hypothetical protein